MLLPLPFVNLAISSAEPAMSCNTAVGATPRWAASWAVFSIKSSACLAVKSPICMKVPNNLVASSLERPVATAVSKILVDKSSASVKVIPNSEASAEVTARTSPRFFPIIAALLPARIKSFLNFSFWFVIKPNVFPTSSIFAENWLRSLKAPVAITPNTPSLAPQAANPPLLLLIKSPISFWVVAWPLSAAE